VIIDDVKFNLINQFNYVIMMIIIFSINNDY